MNILIQTTPCNCQFHAFDSTDYLDQINKYVFVEFLSYNTYNEDPLAIEDSKRIVDNNSDYRNYYYDFKYDGLYQYNKYAIYKLDALQLENGSYATNNRIFYYNNNVYFGLNDLSSLSEINTGAKRIYNWCDLQDYSKTRIDNYYIHDIFTYCHLNQCVIKYQKETIFNKLNSCKQVCKTDTTKELRDFLFITVYILDYLVCQKNYLEAQRILESLSSCAGICDDNSFINNNCNCKNE